LSEREAALVLVLAQGAGPAMARRLRQHCRSYERAVRLIARGRAPAGLVPPAVASAIGAVVDGESWRGELLEARRRDARFAIDGEPDYPAALSEICDPPVGLFIRGSVLSELWPMVGIVGSRRATPRGRAIAAGLSADLAAAGLAVVSGMARGIDTAAHEGAIGAGGSTVAVLGSGLGRVYPPENARLAEEIAASGAVVSEFPMRAEAMPGQFPRRNRIISGLSAGLVVVEAAERSGALITAARALEQGREVFAVPGPVDEPMSVGTNRLIKAGAALVENADDVLEALEPAWGPFRSRPCPGPEEDRDIATAETPDGSLDGRLVSHLSLEPSTVDRLIAISGATAAEVLSALLRLELSSRAEKVEGDRYILGERIRRARSGAR
jgi:DNA processing protein